MAKLYELSEQYRKFNDLVEEGLDNEELTEDDIQMFIDTIDSIKDAIDGKCENIVKFMKNIEGDINAFKAEEQRLNKKRKYLENKYDGLKTYMSQMLVNANIKKVNAGNFTIKFQKSPASVEVLHESSVPTQYREAQPDKIKKKEILADLKAGKIVSGVVLVEDKEHLRIS